jgi:large subunit ribosomal protein L21
MYAIVKTGGKQYRVERGQTLLVERLPGEAGSNVALEPILYRSEDTVFDADGLAKVSVDATIVEHLRGEKLRVFKFKPKRGYKRRTGHRQELTRIEVTDIKLAGASKGKSGDAPAPVRASRTPKDAPATPKDAPATPEASAPETPDATAPAPEPTPKETTENGA